MKPEAPLVELQDPRVRAMPAVDCGEPLVDVAGLGWLLVGPPPECPETEPDYRFVRAGLIPRLERAQARLPAGLRLRLYEGWRSAAIQRRLFAEQLERTTRTHPHHNPEQRYAEAAKLASPLATFDGEPTTPPHSTGGAIDIEIVDEAGAVIDFGMEAKDWTRVEPEFCATRHHEVSAVARHHRLMLADALEAEGFVNYPREWWHYSCGDRYWAFLTGRPHAIYDRVA